MREDARRDDFRPKTRSTFRLKAGAAYYTFCRYMLWLKMRRRFAKIRPALSERFPYFRHKTPLRRALQGEDACYQDGKIKNLSIAVKRLDGVVVRPGEIFSYWRQLGRPTAKKGYVDGMVLNGGIISPGIGGGLCQMSNLIYWMTLHTPLTVIERYRHGYDVFPDANRTQPFGSGATCSYPYLDLMIRNDTGNAYRLSVGMDDHFLTGCWYSDAEPRIKYEIIEKNHEMRGEPFGGFSRHNELWRLGRDMDGNVITEELVAVNHAMMMYSPLLSNNDDLKERL